MKLSNFWSGLLVTFEHLRDAFSDAQDADRAVVADHGLTKVVDGFTVTEDPGGPSLEVEVAAGLAHDKLGARLRAVAPFTASFAADEDDLSTEVLSNVNERWVALFLRAARYETTPQGPALTPPYTVNFESFESYETFAVPGAEAPIGTAVRPPLDSEALLLCEVLLQFGQTTIADADLDFTRTEIMLDTPAATAQRPYVKKYGTVLSAVYDLYSAVNDLVSGANVQYDGGRRHWALILDPVYTASPQSVQQCLIDLPAALADAAGESRIGADVITVGSVTLGSGSVLTHTTALVSATNHSMPAAGNFTATTTSGWLTALTTTTDATHNGAYYIGAFAHGNFTGANVYAQLAELDKTAAGDDGAKRVKTEAVGDLAGSTVRAQLNELDTGWGKLSRANNWTAQQTLTAPSAGNVLILSGTDSKARFEGEVVCLDGLAVSNGTLNYLSTGTSVTATFNGPVVRSAATATYAERVGTLDGTSTSQTLYVTKDIWYTNGTTFIGTATYTIDDTGAADGNSIRVAVLGLPSGRTIDFKKPGGTTILSAAGAGHVFATFMRMGGVWFPVGYSGAAVFIE